MMDIEAFPHLSDYVAVKKLMLAVKAKDINDLTYPLLASPKLDGIRCAVLPRLGAVTRTFKEIKNQYIRNCLYSLQRHALDGELVTYHPDGHTKDFNECSGDIMRAKGEPEFKLLVFDCMDVQRETFGQRIVRAESICNKYPEFLELVPHEIIDCPAQLADYEAACVSMGFEGVMTRCIDAPYNQGRSTAKQEWLLKIKRFEDDEAVITGFDEEMENTNEKDASGKRTTHRSGLVPKDSLGAFQVTSAKHGEFSLGGGFTAAQRKEYWGNRKALVGCHVKYSYQPSGMKVGGKPRFPVFIGFRDIEDMGV